MKIEEAIQQVRAVLPRPDVSVAVTITVWSWKDGRPTEVNFSVWDDQRSFVGRTLEAAVEAAVLHHSPAQAIPEEVDNLLAELPAGPAL
jgi:hypothetical protein